LGYTPCNFLATLHCPTYCPFLSPFLIVSLTAPSLLSLFKLPDILRLKLHIYPPYYWRPSPPPFYAHNSAFPLMMWSAFSKNGPLLLTWSALSASFLYFLNAHRLRPSPGQRRTPIHIFAHSFDWAPTWTNPPIPLRVWYTFHFSSSPVMLVVPSLKQTLAWMFGKIADLFLPNPYGVDPLC